MSRQQVVLPTTDALCKYEECRFCVHRVNVSRTPAGEGQCDLEVSGRARVEMCKGRLFFALAADRAPKYRSWMLSNSLRGRSAPRTDGE